MFQYRMGMGTDLKIYIYLLFLVASQLLVAQTPGINYQALILNQEELLVPGSNIGLEQAPLASAEVLFRFVVSTDPDSGFTVYYEEEQLTTTDANGLVSLIVGEGVPIEGVFSDIVWDGTPKYLNVEINILENGNGFVFLDSQKILYLPQSPGGTTLNATNGLVLDEETISLGGALTRPTQIVANGGNTLALNGLALGDASVDELVAIDPSTGVLKRVPQPSGFSRQEQTVVAIDGQTSFTLPLVVADPQKIDVFRNGVKIGFVLLDSNTLQLEAGVICFQDDEIRIVQYN